MTTEVVVVIEDAPPPIVVNIEDAPAPIVVEISEVGLVGPPGPSAPGVTVYVHTQSTPAATWTISHGLGRVPHGVTVYISGELVDTDVDVDATTVVLTFSSPMAGEAHIL